LARGGRINFFGFILRLMARLPFLFIAGRMYGAEQLGRFAYAVLILEFASQLATLGPQARPRPATGQDRQAACLRCRRRAAGRGDRIGDRDDDPRAFPQAMFPNSEIHGMEWALPITVFALAWSDICLAALAYRHDVTSTVRARAIIEPWTISIAAFGWYFISPRDGLIIAYAMSMVAALVASIIPFLKSYGLPHDWRPIPACCGASPGATCR
jgi:O-antigen/teichoic acid export membrane protein